MEHALALLCARIADDPHCAIVSATVLLQLLRLSLACSCVYAIQIRPNEMQTCDARARAAVVRSLCVHTAKLNTNKSPKNKRT